MLTMCCASEGVIGRKALGSSSSSPSSKDCFRAVFNVAVRKPCAPSAALKCALQVSTFEGGSSPTLLVPQASNHLNEHSLIPLKFIDSPQIHRRCANSSTTRSITVNVEHLVTFKAIKNGTMPNGQREWALLPRCFSSQGPGRERDSDRLFQKAW